MTIRSEMIPTSLSGSLTDASLNHASTAPRRIENGGGEETKKWQYCFPSSLATLNSNFPDLVSDAIF